MRNKKVIFALFAFALCSCQTDPVYPCDLLGSSSKTTQARVYEAFGSYTAKQVEEICKTYAKRMQTYSPEIYYLEYDFGTYGDMHVNVLKSIYPGMADICVESPFCVAGYHICTFPYPSYGMNVWIEGEGSFSLERLYLERKITDEDIRSIMAKAEELGLREHKTFDTKAEDFSFSLTWDFGVDTYDSKNNLITVRGITNTYTASFQYPNLDALYEKVKALDIYSYFDEFEPYVEYSGNMMMTLPSTYYLLQVGDKTIRGSNCPVTGSLSEDLMSQGKKFLNLVFEIIDTIENSDEYKSIEVPEDDRMVFY